VKDMNRLGMSGSIIAQSGLACEYQIDFFFEATISIKTLAAWW